MSFNEIALVVGGVAVGVASGSLAVYYTSRKSKIRISPDVSSKETTVTTSEKNELESDPPSITEKKISEPVLDSSSSLNPHPSRMIPKDILEKSRRELRTLLLEKELVSAALTRLYEAEAAKEITREERETLGAKYRDELKSLDDRILKVDAFIEVGDLETLRDQLVRLVNQKMDSIDRRIESTRRNAEPLIALILAQNLPKPAPPPTDEKSVPVQKPRVPDISDMLKPEEPKPVEITPQIPAAPEGQQKIQVEPLVPNEPVSPSDPRLRRRPPIDSQNSQADELQRELLEALDRLEKLDVET